MEQILAVFGFSFFFYLNVKAIFFIDLQYARKIKYQNKFSFAFVEQCYCFNRRQR